jgi:hypothetical protein
MMTEAHRNDETNGLRLFNAVVGRLEVVNAHDSFESWIAVILYPLCSKYVLRAHLSYHVTARATKDEAQNLHRKFEA